MSIPSSRRYSPELLIPFIVVIFFYVLLGIARSIPAPSEIPVQRPVAPINHEAAIASVAVPSAPIPLARIKTIENPETLLKPVKPGTPLTRNGDEIVVCGQLFHTGTAVVLWTDPGGYDAYRTELRFAPFAKSDWEQAHALYKELKTPNRYGLRKDNLATGKDNLSTEEIERVRGGGWDLPLLQSAVDQFVIHYDVAGTSQSCFRTLHDARCLSVHFMLDVDGTIYQTLDLKERAWHATTSNSRSVGVEVANIGAYPDAEISKLDSWYSKDSVGNVTLKIAGPGNHGIRTANFVGHPIRNEVVEGTIQNSQLHQYDLTPQQYDALIKLTATLCTVFPKLKCDYPKDASGALVPKKLDDDKLKAYQGVLGHYHLDTKKVDPGPALQWDRIIDGARTLMHKKER